jgi:hypothetical protein
MDSWEWANLDFAKIAEDHAMMARSWTREVQGAYSDARARLVRTRALVEKSRRQLHKSDELLRWCEAYGPRPILQHAEDRGR